MSARNGRVRGAGGGGEPGTVRIKLRLSEDVAVATSPGPDAISGGARRRPRGAGRGTRRAAAASKRGTRNERRGIGSERRGEEARNNLDGTERLNT